ncbi:GIY-YIG nuclease family protein [Gemmobacter fulvus]|uniref:GIY-YIG nuclease family protein n=1 Tax=Gemmobacter fulvus TaxID=2840474 RepID=UPI00279680A9|nr:GIY-YIG nuclease family protein [Gemmobacter fulvus]MDQ1850633.1 GIY-YIG nuclease family protein [Gemmobacter fulvus]
MVRPTLDEIFAEPDEFGLLDVKLTATNGKAGSDPSAIKREIEAFRVKHGRLPDAEAADHEEMRLGTIRVRMGATPASGEISEFNAPPERSWRDDPLDDEVPEDLDDIFGDAALAVSPDLVGLRHVTAASERQLPDHRADFRPCQDFDLFEPFFQDMQRMLDAGERKAAVVEKYAVIEPLEGDFFIRNGLLAYIAEKTEMSSRGGDRDHRLRVVFSNGQESDPLMSSFRKSLNDDKTSRLIQRTGLGPLDPEWEADRLELSGTIYVARSLSTVPEISENRMILHKIGVTSQQISRRIADARNDATFLMAPVEIIATYDLKNLSRSKVENLLHRFFEAARPAELSVVDRLGKKIHPREWFYVLPEHVGQAAKLIEERRLHEFKYDPREQRIVAK